MRMSAIGAPLSIARIGSTSPPLTLILMEFAASCWMTLALDCARTRSIVMPSAAKNPLRMPIAAGHRLVEPDATEPAMMVSAAPAGTANERVAANSAIAARTDGKRNLAPPAGRQDRV